MGFPKGPTERNEQAGRELVQIIKTQCEKHGNRLHAGALATLRARISFIGNHGTAEEFAIEWSVFRKNIPEMGAELRRLIHLAAMEHPAAQAIGPDRINEHLNGLVSEFEQKLLDDGAQLWLKKPSPNDASPFFFGNYRRRYLLGQVIAWTANVAAALVLVIGAMMIANNLKGNEATVSFVLLAAAVVVIWGIGRGFRYMLAGT